MSAQARLGLEWMLFEIEACGLVRLNTQPTR